MAPSSRLPPMHLHLSARPEELLALLRPRLAAARAAVLAGSPGVPRPVPVLVPSPQLSEWLQARLARDLGLSMGFEFLAPSAWFGRPAATDPATTTLADAHAAWSPDRLRWRLLPHLDAAAVHLGHDATHPLGPRDRFAFARLLAHQFDHYARHRPDWPAAWDRLPPSRPPGAAPAEDEAWQRELWRVVATAPDSPPHPALLLAQLARTAPRAADPARPLFVLGTDLVDPLLLRSLQALVHQGYEVSLFLLLPSLGYLGDLSRRAALRPTPEEMADPTTASGHPLLASLGQLAAGVFRLLETVSPDYAAWPDDPAAAAPPPDSAPLLPRLQSDIRLQRPPPGPPLDPAAADARPLWLPDDHSLRVHSCHSPRRELEVLRDELRRAFAELPGLRPEDVLVAVTDFDRYAPLADGVLRAGAAPLPVRLTAIAAREANPVAVALLALLRLASGRHAASEVIDLLALSAVQQRLGIAGDADLGAQLADTIRQSGLTHGLDAGDRPDHTATGTWRTALDRHLAGLWFGPEPVARDATGALVHPLAGDLHHHDAVVQRFLAWLAALAGHLSEWEGDAPARTWADRLARAIDDLLACEPLDDHAAALRRQLGELTAVAADTTLDDGAVCDWLEARLENATSLRTSMGGEILFGRLDQIHGLPCRVLALLGLEDGAFPRAARRPAWDLLAHDPRPWDPDPRRQDRQWFLDCLLAPTDRLILSAANRSLRTPHDGPLSSCVEELLRTAAATVRPADGAPPVAAALVIRHRLQPFAADYFLPGGDLPRSYAAAAAGIAAGFAAGGAAAPAPFFSGEAAPGPAPLQPPSSLTLADLLRFWRDPARAWLRALQIEMPGDEDDDASLDDAPLALAGLTAFTVRRAALASRLPAADSPEAVTRERLAADRALPPGLVGTLVWERSTHEIAPLAGALGGLLPGATPLAVDLAPAGHPRLTGEVLLRDAAAPTPRVLVYRPGRYEKRPVHQLDALLATLAAALQLDRPVGALVLGIDQPAPRELPPLAPPAARALLQALLAGFEAGQLRPLGYAPETSAALATALARGDPDPLARAEACWHREAFRQQPAGEGHSPAAQLAWRENDPFAPPHAADWQRWATAIAAPLQAWWDGEAPSAAPATSPEVPPVPPPAAESAASAVAPRSSPRRRRATS
jgi:exodeoxyribonuclease V gamma subunit